jgi:glycosyltransferase involved in cell wall biosynthesis
MPRTVLEAAALGRPAIVTDVPGCRQAIVPGLTGWLCKVRDAQDLAATMLAVLKIGDISEYGNNAAYRVSKEFSEGLVINAYLECLSEISGHKSE